MISLSRIILDLVLDGLEIPILRETFPRRVLIDFNLMKVKKIVKVKKIMKVFKKSISQGIGSKFWYPQNQHDSLNQIQRFELYKSPTQES